MSLNPFGICGAEKRQSIQRRNNLNFDGKSRIKKNVKMIENEFISFGTTEKL